MLLKNGLFSPVRNLQHNPDQQASHSYLPVSPLLRASAATLWPPEREQATKEAAQGPRQACLQGTPASEGSSLGRGGLTTSLDQACGFPIIYFPLSIILSACRFSPFLNVWVSTLELTKIFLC